VGALNTFNHYSRKKTLSKVEFLFKVVDGFKVEFSFKKDLKR
jgi:hypothetical protein